MDTLFPAIALIIGGGIGFFIARMLYRNAGAPKEEFDQTKSEKIALNERCEGLLLQLSDSNKELKNKEDALSRARENVVVYETEKKNLEERFIENRKGQEEMKEEMKEKMQNQFENLANKIFDEKNKAFQAQSQTSIQNLLNPFKERFKEFQKVINDSFGDQAKEQFALKEEIKRIVETNEKMTFQTESLTKALRGDVKAQGNWGEVILEKILDDSGLTKNVDYTIQATGMGLKHPDGEGKTQRPDVIILLPEDKHIIIDSKLTLTSYENFSSESKEDEKARYLKQFVHSVKTHINGLEKRCYQDSKELSTPDFVLMFMPIEGAYSLVLQSDRDILRHAWDKKVVIVCPSTLFATLRTVASIWRLERQNRNTLEIARQGGDLYDKIAGFIEDMQKIGDQLGKTQKSYDDAMNKLSHGRGNILGRTEKLRELGVKSKKILPKELLNDDPEQEIE